MIDKIVRGKNAQAQSRFENLCKSIGDNPNILWYPSSGDDYRDLLELTPERAQKHGISELPDLFIHTDYNYSMVNTDKIIFKDERTSVEIENKYELELTKRDTKYFVNPNYIDFPEYALNNPTIYLLDILITSDTLGQIKQPVIYFLFENINFLDEIILKNKIRISHIVKVKEGCGFGGGKECISIVYAFLSYLNTKYLLIDHQENTNFEIINQLKNKHSLTPHNYELTQIDFINKWSDLSVKVFSIKYKPQKIDNLRLIHFLHQIDGISI